MIDINLLVVLLLVPVATMGPVPPTGESPLNSEDSLSFNSSHLHLLPFHASDPPTSYLLPSSLSVLSRHLYLLAGTPARHFVFRPRKSAWDQSLDTARDSERANHAVLSC